MTNFELVFIPSPGLSHLVTTVEAAKLLLDRDGRLSATVLLTKLPMDAASVARYTQEITATNLTTPRRLRLLHLPGLDGDQAAPPPPHAGALDFNDKETARVRETISNLIENSSEDASHHLAGLVLDMFCTKFIAVARELGLPAYVFFTSGACGLGLSQHLVELRFEQNQDLTQYKNSDSDLSMPYFKAPVPAGVLPAAAIEGGAFDFLSYFKKLKEADGIMVNTFYDLESYAIESLLSNGKTPKVYPIGPILNRSSQFFDDDDDVKKWLDDQPESSVVFLCFGTMGSLDEAQVREIALALENCGCRFLWSLRKPGAEGAKQMVVEYDDLGQVLPEGFLDRTKGVGRVVGWVAQVAVLGHVAVGGFVSHCGWNSILESMWFGVPIATFPLYAEQQLNAFQLVKELEVAEMIRLDYKMDLKGEGPSEIVGWREIKAAVGRLMGVEGGSRVREKVEEMRKKAKAALVEGGTSYNAQNVFIQDVIRNIGL